MSAQADITVFDGAATPVSHTLKALGVWKEGKDLIATWAERNPALPMEANPTLTLSRTAFPSGVVRNVAEVEVPTMESISGQNAQGYTAAPAVAFTDKHQYVSFCHPRSTPTGHRLARQMLINLMGNVSTSVAAATTGAIPDAVDNGVMPS